MSKVWKLDTWRRSLKSKQVRFQTHVVLKRTRADNLLLCFFAGKQSSIPGSVEKKKSKGFFHSPLRSKKSTKADKSKSAADLTNVGSGLEIASATAPSLEEVHLHMASEASRRAEDDRMKRIRMQEEQDLAYAIALSKAEAASLKNWRKLASKEAGIHLGLLFLSPPPPLLFCVVNCCWIARSGAGVLLVICNLMDAKFLKCSLIDKKKCSKK